ncbi:diguanylate cyclase domain-containing protein [Uliginosibacterium paludis]|uniref:Diguanylate cyclase n=1 Tax=Uliginosibacterium paludis TaxID=1615952 RepID=A0ABV2CQB2_9RHOO
MSAPPKPIRRLLSARLAPAGVLSLVMGLGIACLILQSVVHLWSSHEHALEEAADSLSGLSATLASRLDATLRPIDACTRSTRQSLQGVGPVLPRLADRTDHSLSLQEWARTGLAQCVASFDELADMMVTDAKGEPLVRVRGEAVGQAVGEVLRKLGESPDDVLWFSGVLMTRDQPMLVAALPVRAADGEVIAQVAAVIRLDRVAGLFEAVRPADGSVIALRRSDDTRLLVRVPPQEGTLDRGVAYRLADELRAGSRKGLLPELRSPVDGVTRVTAYHRLETYPFYVAASRSRAEILDRWLWHAMADSGINILLIAMLSFGAHALGRRERNFRALFDAVSDFLFVLDDQGRVIHFNRSARHRLGMRASTLLQQPFASLLDDADAGVLERAAALAQDTGCPCALKSDHDEMLPVELRLMAGKWNGLPARFVLCRDVSELMQQQKLLEREVERYQLALERTRDGIFLMRLNGDLIEYNSAFRDMLGYSDEEMLRLNVTDWDARFPPEELRRIVGAGGADHLLIESRHRRRDGSEFDVEIGACGVAWSGEKFRFGTVRDISGRKRAEARLRLYSEAFHHAAEGIAITTPDGTVQEVNDALCEIMGYRRAELIGRNDRLFSAEDTSDARFAEIIRTLHRHGFWRDQIMVRHRDGRRYPQQLTLSVVRDEAGKVTHHVALFSDISSLKENERALQDLANTDSLTGLPNRALLATRLAAAMAEARQRGRALALAYLDLDGFKAVNDRHGHAMGDRLLVSMASRLAQVLRQGDTLARLGGDEFVILLPDQAKQADILHVLERVLAEASRPFLIDDILLQVSASIGVSLFPQDEVEDAEGLLAGADQAMYRAKRSGKNRLVFLDRGGQMRDPEGG